MRTLIELSQECDKVSSLEEVLKIRKEHKQELCSYISSIQDDKDKAFLIKNALDCHDNIMQMFMLKIKRM